MERFNDEISIVEMLIASGVLGAISALIFG